MKKLLLCGVLAAGLVLTLCACSSKTATTPATPVPATTAPATTAPATASHAPITNDLPGSFDMSTAEPGCC